MLYIAIAVILLLIGVIITTTNWVGRVSSLEEENYLLKAENYEAKKRNEKLREQLLAITRQVRKIKQQSNKG